MSISEFFKKIFGKKEVTNIATETQNDRNIVERNYRLIDALLALTEDNEAFSTELRKFKDELRFLTWSHKPEVIAYDEKIYGLINELKNDLVCGCNDAAREMLRNLKMTVSERNAIL